MTYRLKPSKPLTTEVRRIAAEELEQAAASFEQGRQGDHEEVHNARKRLKKLRGLYRLVRDGAGDFYAAENARLRDAARALSAVRDATAMIETVDKLRDHISEPVEPEVLTVLRKALAERRDRVAEGELDLAERAEAAAKECRAALEAVESLSLPGGAGAGAKVIAKGWARTYGRGKAARKQSRRSDAAEDFHELRKRVKYHWMHVRLLQDLWPSSMRIRRNEAKALADLIGDEHDLSVLTDVLAGEPELVGPEGERDVLARLVSDRQAELRREALARTRVLFREPTALARDQVRLMWKRAAG